MNIGLEINLRILGNQFIWRKRINNDMIFEKLDRCLGRKDWILLYLESYYIVGIFICLNYVYIEFNILKVR